MILDEPNYRVESVFGWRRRRLVLSPFFGRIVWAAATLIFLTGASEPEVVRVRVPAPDVSRYFPPGTELRVMTAADFEAKVAAALAAPSIQPARGMPRLIRARHRAWVSSGILTGTSELVIETARAGAGEYVLEPWTPAIIPAPEIANVLAARPDGKPALLVDRGPTQAIQVNWELQARKYSRGRGFVLRLPGGPTSVLSLETPRDWEPVSRRGIRRGPQPTRMADRVLWEFGAELGQIDVHLFDPDGSGKASLGPIPWLRSAIEVDLRGAEERPRGVANWTANWQIAVDPRNPTPLEIDLDPGLELIDIRGTSAASYRVEQHGATKRVNLALEAARNSPTEIEILAHVSLPPEGAWTIPTARPIGAIWTGGTTTVLLGGDIVLSQWRERSGRRVFPAGAKAGPGRRLVFESESPGPAAELVFAGPRGESSCDVRGQLYLGGGPGRLKCRLSWKVQRGLLPDLEIDLKPGWVPDDVRFLEFSDPTIWRLSASSGGGTRIHVALPPAMIARKEFTVELGAVCTESGDGRFLELPRVRPQGARVADEAWVAWVGSETLVRPNQARGIAWIDPRDAFPAASAGGGPELHEALAWRWISESGSATIERERIDQEPRASITMTSRIDAGGERLVIDGRIEIDANVATLGAIPVWVNAPGDALRSWRFQAETGGPPLLTRPIDDAAIAQMGFPPGGSARTIAVDIRAESRKSISFHREIPWRSVGLVPLLSLPRRYRPRGVIEIQVPPAIRARIESVGLRRVEASPIAQPDTAGSLREYLQARDELVSGKNAVRHSFSYAEPTGRLELATQSLTQYPLEGIIQEAVLTTTARPGSRSINRLRLMIQLGEARALQIKTPIDLSITRVRRDGLDVVPMRSKSGLSIPLETASPGSRMTTIVMEYDGEGPIGSDRAGLAPPLPKFEMSCLSFVWEVVTPSGWEPAEWSGGLEPYDPFERSNWPFGALRIWRPWSRLGSNRNRERDSSLYQALDSRLVGRAADTMTFGEWFARWDSGPRPLVIDRLSLDLAGFGPKSPCVLSGVLNKVRSDISLATLKHHGLALLPLHAALVVTTEDGASQLAADGRFGALVSETLIWGSDRTDRLQTVARWRGEPTPKHTIAAGEAFTDQSRPLPGWSSWRFASSDWPSGDTSIRLADMRARIVSAWLAAGLSFIAYLFIRSWLIRWRGVLLVTWLATSMALAAIVPSRWDCHSAAVMLAGCAAVIVEVCGRRSSRAPFGQTASSDPGEILANRAGVAISGVLAVGLFLSNFAAAGSSEPSDRQSAILALFPDDSPDFDPEKPLEKVILRLADFNRLERLAQEASSKAPQPPSVRAASASHRIVRQDARNVLVESEYELEVRGKSPSAWMFPVSATRDIEATLDGNRQAISIKPGGDRAVLELPTPGRHVLRLRRLAGIRPEGDWDVLRVPISPIPVAAVVVEPARAGAGEAQLTAWGRIERRGDQTLVGRLGPADKIEIRWPKLRPDSAARENGHIDGLVLWDIHPAGDRLRARLRVQQIQDGAVLRIRHDPRLILRSAQVSNLVNGFWVESVSHDEWTLHAEPPIGPDSEISIDCWMPIAPEHSQHGALAAAGSVRRLPARRMPRIKPVGFERYSGVFGVRRPGDWTGRLESLSPAEPAGDESFVRAWGSLPDEPLTLCGAGRFVGECAAALRTGPTPSRVQLKPSVQLSLEPGRIAVTVDAEIVELSGHALELDLSLPESFSIVEVTGDSLTDWRIGRDRQLRLMVDAPAGRPRRTVRIAGWIPVNDDERPSVSQERALKTPWISGADVEFATGFLKISSASRTSLRGASGVTLISSESSPAVGSMPPRHRYSYQVDDPLRLGQISWQPPAPRVNVAIESQLTLYPDSAEWVAALRYDVSGGALDAIHLRLPASWSDTAEIDFTGGEFRLTKEAAGLNSFWTIIPNHPISGSERFVLRSKSPLPADRELIHPEIAPLGWGAVDAYVGVVNATGRSLSIAKSTGLQSIAYSTKFRTIDFGPGVGTPLGAYRVMSKEWMLQVQLARSSPPADKDEQSRVALADLVVSAAADASSTGRAIYDLYAGGGRMLSFELPSGSTLLSVTVDGNPTQPLKDSARRWSIILENRRASRVCVIWSRPAAPIQANTRRISLELPRAGVGQSPALLALHLPPQTKIDGELPGLEPAAPPRFELARAERLGRVISDLVSRIDRSSGRDHEELVSLLINQELALRDAQRSSRASKPLEATASSDRVERELALIESARNNRLEILRRAGLDNDLASAQAYLGQSPKGPDRPLVGVPEAYATDRVRSTGERTTFVGAVAGVDGPPAQIPLAIGSASREGLWHPRLAGGVLLMLAFLAAALSTLIPRRRTWVDWLGPALVLFALGYSGEPAVLLGGMAIAAIACWTRR
jgi:hypothetical protein